MQGSWTFGNKLAAGFGLMVLLIVLVSALAVASLQAAGSQTERLVNRYTANMVNAQRLQTEMAQRMALTRGFLLSQDADFLARESEAERRFSEALVRMRGNQLEPAERLALDQALQAERAWDAAKDEVVRSRRAGADLASIVRQFDEGPTPLSRALIRDLDTFTEGQASSLAEARARTEQQTTQAMWLMIGIAIAGVVIAVVLAVMLTRTLTRQIGGAVQDLTSSSAELQVAANQQATGSGEQASALVEVSSTMKELLSTSRQITDSAKRVAQIADGTAEVARVGDDQVARAMEAVSGIKRQVDVIVAHMLDLGQNSQQIGGILGIIKELAEQTNILAINAAIEAAGAGESGRRFAVVAEEIRKLADRVGGSAGEIRVLIEEIRSSSNTTVMATEEGAKAVEAGSRQFGELAASFRRIVDSVGTTAEAAREIELSIKQQTTAVEQVNVAINDVAQAAKEMEVSSKQTLDTSSQLAKVSRDLGVLVQAPRR